MVIGALFIPLVSFFLLISCYRWMSRNAIAWVACGAVLSSFLLFVFSLVLFSQGSENSITLPLYRWLSVPGLETDFTLHLDPLSFLMSLIITGVGFLIHVYSIGYMEHEHDLSRYFGCLNLFVFAMLLLVLAGDLPLLFIGWEGVGLASYLLIGFWHDRPAAAAAATKAFVINRMGDFGLLLAIVASFYLFGTSHIETIVSEYSKAEVAGVSLFCLLLTLGAFGKSAQIPLQVWLPDAMEGPTPVSALIHAATMVTAGVYLIVRFHPLFLQSTEVLYFVGIIGGVTSLYAACSALAQSDLKRVLAYSTISQLGLMFLACGAGAFYAAMFHLTTHAFVKALLFLSAGNVVHAMHGETEMEKMGGLKKVLPKTRILFLLGALALAGLPPFGAFLSKELILEQEHLHGPKILYVIALSASILTAFYLIRAYSLTFRGELKKENTRLLEVPPVMWVPSLTLAACSLAITAVGLSFFQKAPLLEGFLDDLSITSSEKAFSHEFLFESTTWLALIGSIGGVVAGWYLYQIPSLRLFKSAFYFDEIYQGVLVAPLKSISRAFSGFLEPEFFERNLLWFSKGVEMLSLAVQPMQSGQIRSYAAWILVGASSLLITLVFWGFHA